MPGENHVPFRGASGTIRGTDQWAAVRDGGADAVGLERFFGLQLARPANVAGVRVGRGAVSYTHLLKRCLLNGAEDCGMLRRTE